MAGVNEILISLDTTLTKLSRTEMSWKWEISVVLTGW